ncbi:MAG: DUF4268 domain-containing protein [Chitinophaga sp.]|uniref:DUF4268 domain-containing protein n=1 Tax=Chitinophaga sp. TaxID=1869181 RepID=UPI0025BCC428|nr:DUF4268 domain-containing protein [Chitinophaga sp.]MBV8253562.1 DUF4268 domain-containing protein [Chitinophaga sp.]
MYTKEEVSRQKQSFWTAFGKYMKPVLSADGDIISWSNYKTGIPGISFKLDADFDTASVAIVILQKDIVLQEDFYLQFEQQRSILAASLEEDDWEWELEFTDEYGRTACRISKEISGVNVMRPDDWPKIISFFKPRIIALDEYWSMAKYSFEALLTGR